MAVGILCALRITDQAMEVADDNNEVPLDENELDNNQSNEELHAVDSEEEDECRVCRGPAEEGWVIPSNTVWWWDNLSFIRIGCYGW